MVSPNAIAVFLIPNFPGMHGPNKKESHDQSFFEPKGPNLGAQSIVTSLNFNRIESTCRKTMT